MNKYSKQLNPKLTIVILSYNVSELLLKCLDSLPQKKDWEVVVVDNASTDNSVRQVKKHFPWVNVIENSANLGFSAGNNVALKKIVSEYTLLLNPDTVVLPNTIETVLSFMEENPGVGAATCRVELPNGQLDYSCHRGFPTPLGALLHFTGLRRLSPYSWTSIPNQIHEIDALTGAFALIRTAAGQQVGWLDEDYFWNGEDLDFCYKLKEKGWKIMFLPAVKIIHYKGASSGIYKNSSTKPNPATKAKSILSATQVMRIFYRKHLEKKYPAVVNILVFAGIGLLEKIRLLKNRL